METFYCVGCRASYPLEEHARLSAGVHRDGEAVGFCVVCVLEVEPSSGDATALDESQAGEPLPQRQFISA